MNDPKLTRFSRTAWGWVAFIASTLTVGGIAEVVGWIP